MSPRKLDIPIFYGTFADLTKLDLSFLNGKIVRHRGNVFRKWVKSVLSANDFDYDYPNIMKSNEGEHLYEGDKTWSYAIIPIDAAKEFELDNWNHFYQLVLSIYPSDFSLIKVITFGFVTDKYVFKSVYVNRFIESGGENFNNFMFIAPMEYRFVREYLKKNFQSSLNVKYIKYILSLYTGALRDENPMSQYLSLVICLEVPIEGKEQLTYKLKRNTALLCGKNVKSCKVIYMNVDQLYKLRSSIVHGDIKPSYKHFKEYNDYLKSLVASLIRELVTHNIQTIAELNNIITSLGYGQNSLISSNYKFTKYPFLDNILLRYKTIQKY